MKKLFLFLSIAFLSSFYVFPQQNYTVNGETLVLTMEAEGDLDLLTLKTENGYRFFIRDRNENIVELVNTKDEDDTYFNEYRDILSDFTKDSSMSTAEVAYSKYGLKQFVKAYNQKGTKRFAYTDEKVKAQARLGIFGGITNHPLVNNPNNSKTGYFDVEFELFEKKELPRQSGFLSIEQSFKTDDFNYTSTILALGYRFRFINKPKFNIYANVQFATYTFSKFVYTEEGVEMTSKGNAFRVPFIFGIGSDYKVSDTSYISLIYNELFSAFVENNGNFPINISVGYKFNI